MARRFAQVAVPLAAGLSLSRSTGSLLDSQCSNLPLQSQPSFLTSTTGVTLAQLASASVNNSTADGRNPAAHMPLSMANAYAFARSLFRFPIAHADELMPKVSLENAFRISLVQPLMSYMPDGGSLATQKSASILRLLEETALAGFDASADPLPVVTIAWSLALNGHQPGQAYLDKLQAAAAAGSLSGLPLSPPFRAVLLWCAVMHGVATPAVWEAGLRSLAASASAGALGESTLLYLLHAAMLYATDATTPSGHRAAASAAASGCVSPASPASASAASPACQPRATREEVLAVAAPLGRKALAKLGEVYGEYVPLHPAVEGPYMGLLFVMETLAACVEPAKSWGWSGGGAGAAARQWLPPGAADTAVATLRDPKALARIRRDLLYHWRGDELLDEVQRVRNQVVYLLTRRMSFTVAQPDDVDVAVPSRWLAIYVRHSAVAGASVAATSRSPGASGHDAAGASTSASKPLGSAGSPPAPLNPQDLNDAASDVLEALLRDRFAPQVQMPLCGHQIAVGDTSSGDGGSAAAGCSAARGLWAARLRQLRRLGWRVAVIDAAEWRALGSDVEREAMLLRLLQARI